MSQYFSRVYISEDIKAPKPGREIFEYAVKSSNARKKSSLVVGDDWESDIQGALNFGIDAVYFFPANENNININKDNPSPGNVVYTVNTLEALLKIL